MLKENFINSSNIASETAPPPAATKGSSGSPFNRFSPAGRLLRNESGPLAPGNQRRAAGYAQSILLVELQADPASRNFLFRGLKDRSVNVEHFRCHFCLIAGLRQRRFHVANRFLRLAEIRLIPGCRITPPTSFAASHSRHGANPAGIPSKPLMYSPAHPCARCRSAPHNRPYRGPRQESA